jgi:hypothetical protein
MSVLQGSNNLEDDMKRQISLFLLVALVGVALANVDPGRRQARPLVNGVQDSGYSWGWLAYMARVMPRFVAPYLLQVEPRYMAPSGDIPVPPVCGVSCWLRPVKASGQ